MFKLITGIPREAPKRITGLTFQENLGGTPGGIFRGISEIVLGLVPEETYEGISKCLPKNFPQEVIQVLL